MLVKTSGVTATEINPTITKSGDTSSADNSSFYGQNASMLATNGTLNVKGGTISSTAEGGAGIAAYSSGTVNIADTTITTTANAAGGLHACGGGTLNAWDVTATTAGEHSAAIRSDRGGGTMRVEGGTFKSTGSGSPAIYSTANIAVKGATLTATGSEAASIEGKNSIRLFDCTLSGKMQDSSQNDNTWGVILYQSMSGDSEVGTSEFDMVGGTLDIQNGGYFHTNSTTAKFLLHDVTLSHTNNDSYEYLIRACGNSRWNSGKGSEVNFTADTQNMTGLVQYDSASSLSLYLVNSSTWTGATQVVTTYTGSKTSSITLDSTSKWVVTGNSTIDNLYNAGSIVDGDGKSVTIKQGSSVVVQGTSSYTVTVTGTYSTTADTSSAISVPSYDDYKATKPTVLD
ncbi:MAG: hypothetical protein PUA93_03480 [Eubacteriales bacterium]|nr:hypothetical protein [Eubacteriales bacterium]